MRYLLFAGVEYYPSGGMEDLISSYKEIPNISLRESRYSYYLTVNSKELPDRYDWYHLYDLETNQFITKWES